MSGDELGGIEANGMMFSARTEGSKTVEVSGGMRIGVEGGRVLDVHLAIGIFYILLLGTR